MECSGNIIKNVMGVTVGGILMEQEVNAEKTGDVNKSRMRVKGKY